MGKVAIVAYPACAGAALPWAAVDNQVGHRGRLGNVDRVTSRHLDDGRSRTPGHEALGGRWDHPVVGGNQVPARLRLPGRLADGPAQRFDAPGDLRVCHEGCPFRVYVAREGIGEPGLVQEQIAVLRRQDRGNRDARRWILDQGGHRLPSVRGKRGNVDQSHYLRIVARLGNHRATIGVADEDHGAGLRGHYPSCRLDVIGQRDRGILDHADRVTCLPQGPVDRFPARAVHESAVDENDVHCIGVRCCRHGELLSWA